MEATTTNMTVFEALQEVKLLEQKIKKMQSGLVPIMFSQAIITKDVLLDGDRREDVKARAKSWMDKYQAWTNRMNLIRGLIYESNLKTPMTVGKITYTSVAAAITRYKNLQTEIDFWGSLLKEYRKKQSAVMTANNKALNPEAIAKAINPNGVEYSVESLTELEKNYRESVEQEVFDPLELMKDDWLDNKVNEIVEFKERFHTELNKLNLTTIIEVPIDEPTL